MRSMIRSIVFASAALCATAAFAADRAAINVPFGFDSHGKHFSAGRYDITADTQHDTITLRNTAVAKQILLSTASPADYTASEPVLRMVFSNDSDTHRLQIIQLGSREATQLDRTHRHKAQPEMAQVATETVLTGAQ